MAIDPSKLALALAMIVLLYLGGRLMDQIWPDDHRAIVFEDGRSELEAYQGRGRPVTPPGLRGFGMNPLDTDARTAANYDFKAARRAQIEDNKAELRRALTSAGKDPGGDVGDLKKALAEARDKAVADAYKDYDAIPESNRSQASADARDARVREIYQGYRAGVARAETLDGDGPFDVFMKYEIDRVDDFMSNLLHLDFGRALISLQSFCFTAPAWAIRTHPVYFTIFFLFFLLLWSIFGGAISRIAAVQEARDEKISIRQALRFSTGKVLSFFFAPLIPIIIIGFIVLVLGILFAPTQIPAGFGSIWLIIVGVLFFLALLGGLVMALTGIGLVGGGHLMYPTIAVEGSDSFDAVSRSFSYLYARPWQLLWYTFVSLIYGAITYLFVRFFLYLLLRLTHLGVGLFMYRQAADGTSLMNAIWASPSSPMQMAYTPDWAALTTLQCIGAWFIAFWVFLTISMLGAYAVSLYFSSSTIIYYLMRREVDATAIDEVYLEPNDEDFVDTAPPETATVTTTTVTTTETVLPPSGDVSNPGTEPPANPSTT